MLLLLLLLLFCCCCDVPRVPRPSWESYAINMHNKAIGAPMQNYNSSISGEGNVGGVLPTAIFYLPMLDNGTLVNRYWTYFAVPVADICPAPANGCREQAVLFRFQQLQCAGPNKQPPCKMVGWPMYWNSSVGSPVKYRQNGSFCFDVVSTTTHTVRPTFERGPQTRLDDHSPNLEP